AVAVPIGVRAPAAETARLLAHARVSGLLADTPRAEVARDAAAAVGLPAWVCRPELPLAPRLLRRGRARSAARSRLAAIAYTSGTTGTPKGVMLTHENFLWATLACGQARGDTADAIGTCLSPLTHTPVLVSHLLCRVLAGSSAVLFERFDLGTVLEALERHGISDLSFIGGMVFDVVQAGSVPAAVRQTVRKVSVGGAPTPMEAKRALAEIFAGAEIIEAYGQTEATDGVTMARGGSVFVREGTVGRMNPYVAVAVARADGALAAPGEEGEIVIGGPTVMAGYYRDRAATAAALRHGWLHTGDLGQRDDDGYFFLTGRLKDVIITGGENVSPAEVEEVLRAHPDVADVVVIGTALPGARGAGVRAARRGDGAVHLGRARRREPPGCGQASRRGRGQGDADRPPLLEPPRVAAHRLRRRASGRDPGAALDPLDPGRAGLRARARRRRAAGHAARLSQARLRGERARDRRTAAPAGGAVERRRAGDHALGRSRRGGRRARAGRLAARSRRRLLHLRHDGAGEGRRAVARRAHHLGAPGGRLPRPRARRRLVGAHAALLERRPRAGRARPGRGRRAHRAPGGGGDGRRARA